jgi:hypothetical protein
LFPKPPENLPVKPLSSAEEKLANKRRKQDALTMAKLLYDIYRDNQHNAKIVNEQNDAK